MPCISTRMRCMDNDRSHVDERRQQVRLELIHLLLDHNQRSRALSELLILGSEVPQSAGANAEIAKLFLSAGDAQHALGYFETHFVPTHAMLIRWQGWGCRFPAGRVHESAPFLQAAVNQGRTAALPWSSSTSPRRLSPGPATT